MAKLATRVFKELLSFAKRFLFGICIALILIVSHASGFMRKGGFPRNPDFIT